MLSASRTISYTDMVIEQLLGPLNCLTYRIGHEGNFKLKELMFIFCVEQICEPIFVLDTQRCIAVDNLVTKIICGRILKIYIVTTIIGKVSFITCPMKADVVHPETYQLC